MKLKIMFRRVLRSLIIRIFNICGLMHPKRANSFFNALFSLVRWLPIDIHIMALPLVWMDESKSHKKGLLRHSSKGVAYGPNYVNRAQLTESVSLPAVHFYVFERALVSGNSSSVILDDEQVFLERAIGQDQSKYNYAGGHIVAHDGGMAIVRLGKSENINKGIFLGGNGSFNYYHWMVEILPKLEFISKLPELYQNYPLLVSENVVRIPSFKYTLDLFANGHEIIVLSKELPYIVDELIYINSPNNLPFNLSGNQTFKCNYATIDSRSIDYLRKTSLQAALKNYSRSKYPEKVFLCRKSGLRNYNQDEVFSYLSQLGFTKIFMDDLSFLEQVRTIYHANFIVGPTGAAWTNLIFCRPGAKALCWMAAEFGDFSAYSTIASIVGVDLRYLTYKADAHTTAKLSCKDYYIDPSMIKKGLSALDESFVSTAEV